MPTLTNKDLVEKVAVTRTLGECVDDLIRTIARVADVSIEEATETMIYCARRFASNHKDASKEEDRE